MSTTPQRRLGSLSAEEAARLDAAAVELGLDIAQLMEVAGFQVARCAWSVLGRRSARVHVVAGRGHNGGDGLVAARHLAAWGCSVSALVLAEEESVDDLGRTQARAARGAGVAVTHSRDPEAAAGAAHGADLIVDALLGTGLREPARPPAAEVIEAMCGVVVSIDVPSGLDATTGTAVGATVRAHTTCTLAAMKRGLWNPAAAEYAGRIVVADIGMPVTAWQRAGLAAPSGLRGGRMVTIRRPRVAR